MSKDRILPTDFIVETAFLERLLTHLDEAAGGGGDLCSHARGQERLRDAVSPVFLSAAFPAVLTALEAAEFPPAPV